MGRVFARQVNKGEEMKMTEKECLQAIVIGWSELAVNPRLSKCQTSLDKYFSMCPCCQYVREGVYDNPVCPDEYKEADCHVYCPMISVWPQGCVMSDKKPNSLFTEWLVASGYDKCFFAALIAEWGEYLLNKLKEKKL